MLTKHIIVNEIANDKEYKNLCRKFSPQLFEDLYQDLMVILLQYDESKLILLHETGKIKFFIIKILMNQSRSSTSPFHRIYRNVNNDIYYDRLMSNDHFDGSRVDDPLQKLSNIIDDSSDIITHDLIDKTESLITLYSAVSEDNYYRAKLFELYVLHGSIRKLSRQTNIPVMSIQRSLNDFRTDIKNLLNENTTSTTK